MVSIGYKNNGTVLIVHENQDFEKITILHIPHLNVWSIDDIEYKSNQS